MKIKIISPPVIDCSGLMRSPQLDIGILYSMLEKSKYGNSISMKDFRFFYYDNFYEKYKNNLIFKKEQFYNHKNIISLVKGELTSNNDFYLESLSLYNSISCEFKNIDFLILPISILEQFSLEYLLSSLIFAYFFKFQNPNSKLIFFGTYRSLYVDYIMKNFSFIDGISRKGDKQSVINYINLVKSNVQGTIITNFTYRYNGILINGDEIDVDINIDEIPNYSGFDLEVHKQKDSELVLSYELGQGCRNNCFYCYNLHKGGKYFIKDIGKIINELKLLSINYKTNLFHFNDDEINYSNDFLLNLSNEIIINNLNIYWTALIIPRELDKILLQKLYNSGCRQLRFGIESGSKKILDIIGKETNIVSIESILGICKELGISTYASFIVDLPQEQIFDIKLTMEFIFRNRKNLDNISICAYDTHLGTFDQRYFECIIGEGNYSFYRAKRFSNKKKLLRTFCDKLGIYDIDVIQFMKYNLGKK